MRQIRTALFQVITQRVVVISYRRFGTTSRSHLQGSSIQNIKHNEEASLECVKVEPWAFSDGLIQITLTFCPVYVTILLYRTCVYVCQRNVYGLVEDQVLKRLYLTSPLTRRPNWDAGLLSYWNDLWELDMKSRSSEHLSLTPVLILSVDQRLKFCMDFFIFSIQVTCPACFIVIRPGRKIVKSDYYLRHVCPSVRMERLVSNWTDFYEIRFMFFFLNMSCKFKFH